MLSGKIPTDLGRCSSLELLYMGNNNFQGALPPSLASLKGLRKLDLSENNFSGQIPKYLENFVLEYINLSFNNFDGEVFTKGVLRMPVQYQLQETVDSVVVQLPRCLVETSKRSKMRLVTTVVILISCVICVTVMSTAIYYMFKKKKRDKSPTSLQIKSLEKVSYKMLRKATDGFSSTNLIGRVSSGQSIKALWKRMVQSLQVKVVNLQKQGNDFKELIYDDYMPNRNLNKWLHTNVTDEQPSLSLLQRLSIAIDVGNGLDYLHHHCQEPIVHCDLKPSNILLDNDMVAHVGDFGLAKFLPHIVNPTQSSSNGVRGTSGDVYSYGILLLERVIGKEPTDGRS
uniref:Protein kinase domain-containing protein n=1 Tax=Manihot esculenta TaxID=3983 RepID=A0A2C9VJ80_MANES